MLLHKARPYLGLLLASVFAAACSRTSRPLVELKFWAMGSEGENVRPLLQEFERLHPDITVRLQVLPWTAAHEKLLTAFAGDVTPDVAQLGNTWIPEFRVLDALEPLDERVRDSRVVHMAGYFPGIWETNVIDGALYGIPWYVDTRVLYYRTDIFRRAGYDSPPHSWNEWKDLARKIRETMGTQEGYAILLPTNEWAPPVILGMQAGSLLLRDNDCYGDFSGEPFARAFEFYISFFKEGLAPVGITRVTNVYQAMAEGFVAMYITGPWNIGEFRRRLPDSLQARWMTAPLPGPGDEWPGLSHAGGSSLVIFRDSRHKDAVWKLVEFLSEPARQVAFYRLTGDLPARREAWEDSSLALNRYTKAFFEQLHHVRATPKIPEWEQIAMKVQDYAEAAAHGRLTVKDALGQLDRDVNVILEKRRWMLGLR